LLVNARVNENKSGLFFLYLLSKGTISFNVLGSMEQMMAL